MEMANFDSNQGAARHMFVSMSERKELLSTAMERTSEWILSLEIPCDVTVKIGGTSLSLHKLPLVSKCGYIRKLVSESACNGFLVIDIPDVPGGAEAFELAAKFCYGINFAITAENAAMLRCAAEFLWMTEEYAVGNLVGRTEAFVREVVLKSLSGSVSVLLSSERFLPIAEKAKLVSRCIDTVAYLACKDCQYATPVGVDNLVSLPVSDWWAESLTLLGLDLFRRVLVAMKSRGINQLVLVHVLVLYAQKTLRGLELCGKGRKKIDPREEHQKRVILETIVSLLPQEKNTVPISILSMLLRAAIYLETTVACRLDLEKRMALHLDQATVDDLLILTHVFTGDALFDVETVKRIMIQFLEVDIDVNKFGYHEAKNCFSPCPSEMERVIKLMENYLTKVSSDPNLSVSKFIDLAELISRQSRLTEDGMYRAIDIYLKAHPALSDMERETVCSAINCQKLSAEARAHVAKNDRLPVQTIVQVLCHEQKRLRQAMDDGLSHSPAFSPKLNPTTDEASTLRRENQDLKLELVKMKTRLKEMERSSDRQPAADGPLAVAPKIDRSPQHWKSFISSMSRRLGRLVAWSDGSTIRRSKGQSDKPRKVRRHSVS